MDKTEVIEIVAKFKTALTRHGVENAKIILFGSFAKGNHTETSDIDLVVISEEFIGKDFWERIDILSEAIFEVWKPIEAIAMTPEEWQSGESFICDFAKDGEVLFAA